MDERAEPTPAGLESYLEAIYVLGVEAERVTSAAVAEYLAVTPVSVSRALNRLEDRHWIASRVPEIHLTAEGWRVAGGVVRRHRLAERWLADRLGLDLVTAHKEAERIEHALSPAVERALWEDLGRPGTCPHGNPIPDEEGRVPALVSVERLSDAPPGRYRVERLFEELEGLESLLQFVQDNGLVPGAVVELRSAPLGTGRSRSRTGRRDAGLPRAVWAGGHERRVPADAARRILVAPLGDEREGGAMGAERAARAEGPAGEGMSW